MTDRELALRLNQRDETAVAPFLAQFNRLAFVAALRTCRDDAEARTIACDVLANLALGALGGRTMPVENVGGYIVAAATRLVMATQRARARRWRWHESAEESGQVVSEYSYRVARGAPENDEAPAVSLPAFLAPSELELMTMVGDGWTQGEIGEELGISRDAAKKRIARLRRRAQAHSGFAVT